MESELCVQGHLIWKSHYHISKFTIFFLLISFHKYLLSVYTISRDIYIHSISISSNSECMHVQLLSCV